MQFVDVRDNLRMHTKWKREKKICNEKMKWNETHHVDAEGIGMIR